MVVRKGLTTGDVAWLAGVPQQTLIAWDRAGVLQAARSRRGASGRGRRHYDEDGLVAALVARLAMGMGFKGDQLRVIISLVQKGERKPLEAAAIFTYRSGPGLMTHVFSPEIGRNEDQSWLAHLRERGVLLEEPTTLWTIREYWLPAARKVIQTGKTGVMDALMMMEGLPNE
jgi:DNA-binding transcriptional MerR regulator